MHRAHARAQGGAARARCRDLDHLDDPALARRGRRPRRRAATSSRRRSAWRATTLSGYEVAERARRARHRHREGRRQHADADHDLPARADAVARHRRRARRRSSPARELPGGARRRRPANPFARDRRPAGDAPLRGAALREVDRPRGPAARGDRAGRRRGRRGLSAGHPADPRGLPRQPGRRRLPAARRATRAARSSPATRPWRRCACSRRGRGCGVSTARVAWFPRCRPLPARHSVRVITGIRSATPGERHDPDPARIRSRVLAVSALLLVGAGCGGDENSASDSATTPAATTDTTTATTDTTIDGRGERLDRGQGQRDEVRPHRGHQRVDLRGVNRCM